PAGRSTGWRALPGSHIWPERSSQEVKFRNIVQVPPAGGAVTHLRAVEDGIIVACGMDCVQSMATTIEGVAIPTTLRRFPTSSIAKARNRIRTPGIATGRHSRQVRISRLIGLPTHIWVFNVRPIFIELTTGHIRPVSVQRAS